MTNRDNLFKIVKSLTRGLNAMTHKKLLICIALMLSLPFSSAEAAHKKHTKHPAQASTSKRVHAKLNQSKLNHRADIHKVDYQPEATDKKFHVAGEPDLASAKALVMDQATGEIIYAKNINTPTPIASVTKLMTAMVMLDAHLPMDETLVVTDEDVDTLRGSSSKLPVGSQLTRAELLHMAIMSSENRAASALGRNYPGGLSAFVAAMNEKSRVLGMSNTHFVDSTGLHTQNMSTASDLSKMVKAAYNYAQIREVSTSPSQEFRLNTHRGPVNFSNTNLLVRSNNQKWVIGLSKTGYISEAGRCLVMQAQISGKNVVMVFLDSMGKFSRIGDAERIRKWMEAGNFSPRLS
jgi:D-alanyl-D-alanine endopeptidase (penicillin-binding protein 7)